MSDEARLNVVVLCGGSSTEREVSLATGAAVAEALAGAGHTVETREIGHEREVLAMSDLAAVDAVFPALHGGPGEDGRLQAALDLMGAACAMSGPVACGLAMDKAAAKRIMRGAGIPTADWLLVCGDGCARGHGVAPADLPAEELMRRVDAELGWPVVVKPNRDGSSVGVHIVERPGDFAAACAEVAAMGQSILVERFIPGRELAATILLGRRLPLVEISPRDGFYDYANKYTAGACEYLCPAPVHSPLYERISEDAQRLYDLLGCRGVARVDFRLDGDTYGCLELNAIPGMTATSLVPMAAGAVGIGFADLITDLCREAARRRGERS